MMIRLQYYTTRYYRTTRLQDYKTRKLQNRRLQDVDPSPALAPILQRVLQKSFVIKLKADEVARDLGIDNSAGKKRKIPILNQRYGRVNNRITRIPRIMQAPRNSYAVQEASKMLLRGS